MLGLDAFVFDAAAYIYIGMAVVIDIALIYLNRIFVKKI